MSVRSAGCLLLVTLACAHQAPAPPPQLRAAAPIAVEEIRAVLTDSARQREIPIKIYRPRHLPGRSPLLVFSHGLGSSREGYAYLGKYWASNGYISILCQHHGSDNELNHLGLYRSARAGDVGGNRPLDIRFVLDEMERADRGESLPELRPLAGTIDFSAVGVAGHSYGAYTALVAAGLLIDFPEQQDRSFRDPRIKAAVALSPPIIPGAPRREDYREIVVPLLHMTGTRDRTLIFSTFPIHRRIPFDASDNAKRQYLVTIEGLRHGDFSDEPDRPGENVSYREGIQTATLQFWDAFLRGDPAARSWLEGKGLQSIGKVERR